MKKLIRSFIPVLLLLQTSLMAQCWKQVETGICTSVGIKTDGSLWTWGCGSFGLLGIGKDTSTIWEPMQVGYQRDWKEISCKGTHVLALKNDGSLWAWGDNSWGALGDGSTTHRNKPVRIGTDNDWQHVSAGSDHSLALKNDGSLWAWGMNLDGELGINNMDEKDVPTRIGADKDWASISVGGNRDCHAIKTDGSLWAWGNGTYWVRGDSSIADQLTPARIGTANDWLTVDAGVFHSLAIKKDHSLWVWGSGSFGSLGTGNMMEFHPRPVQVGTVKTWSFISANHQHSLAIRSDGTLWAWGYNPWGQLGLGHTNDVSSPTQVGILTTWSSCAGGHEHNSMGISNNGELLVWGYNASGQRGDSSRADRLVPFSIACPETTSIKRIASAGDPLSVYPVPASGMVDIVNPSGMQVQQVRIIDVLGKECLIIPGEQSHIDISTLVAGMYFVEISMADRVVLCRLVKN